MYNAPDDLQFTGVVSTRLYVLQDGQRSVIALANETGVLEEGYDYDPHGRPTVVLPGVNGEVTFGGDDVCGTTSLFDRTTNASGPLRRPR